MKNNLGDACGPGYPLQVLAPKYRAAGFPLLSLSPGCEVFSPVPPFQNLKYISIPNEKVPWLRSVSVDETELRCHGW